MHQDNQLKKYHVPFSALGDICILANSSDEATQQVNQMLDNGNLKKFFQSISDNIGAIEIETAELEE